MTTSRCPACGAAAPDGAAWCSLCFSPLRPERVPVPASTAAARTGVAATDAADPLTAPLAQLLAPPASPAGRDGEARAAHASAASVPPAAWPCPRCGAAVDLAVDTCPVCGAGFLAGAMPDVTVKLPLVGDLTRLPQGQRLLVGVVVAGLIGSVITLLFTIGAHLF